MAPLDNTVTQPFWLRPPLVIGVVAAMTLAKLWISGQAGLSFDEAYYTLWSLHLAPGYLDHPAMVALLIALGRLVGGDDEFGVRLPAVLCVLALSMAIYRIGVLLVDRNSATLAVIWYNLSLPGGLGVIITPDAPSTLCWALTLWPVAEFIRSKNPNWWLLVGIMLGLGLDSKYTDAFLGVGLLLLFLTSSERRKWFGLWQVWGGVALMLLVFSPVLWWNAEHGWASFWFQGQRTVTSGIDPGFFGNFLDFIAGQMLFMLPVLVIFAGIGMVKFFIRPGAPDRVGLAPLVWTSVPALAYFLFHTLHDRVDANWPGPIWPMLALVAAWAALNVQSRRWFVRWPTNAAMALQILLGVGLIGVIYAQILWQPWSNGSIDRSRETRGWSQLQADIGAIAKAHGARWIATSGDYGVTGEFSAYGHFAHDPLPVRQIDQPERYTYLPPILADTLQWPALLVLQGDPKQIESRRALFGSIEPVGVVVRHHGAETMEPYSAFLVSAPTPAFFAGAAVK